jgi:hypothetical protein
MSRNSESAYQLSLIGATPPVEPRTYRQNQIAWRKRRVANRKRLRRLPFTEAEESVRERT